jgi:phage virion morphogenesis protein
MNITIKVDDRAVQSELQRLQNLADRQSQLLINIGSGIRRSHALRWDKQESPDGKQWQPLSPKYKRWKQKYHPNVANKILVLYGYLKNLAMYSNDSSVTISSNRPYSRTHQYGNSSKNIPKREFLGFSKEDVIFITQEITKYFS